MTLDHMWGNPRTILDRKFEQLVDECERCGTPNYATRYNELTGRAQYRCTKCRTGWTCCWGYSMKFLLDND